MRKIFPDSSKAYRLACCPCSSPTGGPPGAARMHMLCAGSFRLARCPCSSPTGLPPGTARMRMLCAGSFRLACCPCSSPTGGPPGTARDAQALRRQLPPCLPPLLLPNRRTARDGTNAHALRRQLTALPAAPDPPRQADRPGRHECACSAQAFRKPRKPRKCLMHFPLNLGKNRAEDSAVFIRSLLAPAHVPSSVRPYAGSEQELRLR